MPVLSKTYKTTKIISDVKILLDERELGEYLFEDVYHQNLEALIQNSIVDAVQRVHMNAPFHLLDTQHAFGEDCCQEVVGEEVDHSKLIYWEKDKEENPYGHVLLPDDFMRLIVFKMSDWNKPVYQLLPPTDPLYSRQFCPFAGVSGNVNNPLCFLVEYPEGRSLQFFRCNDNTATIEMALYVSIPKIDDEGGISISELCYQSVLYTICSLVCTSIGAHERAKEFDALSSSLLI